MRLKSGDGPLAVHNQNAIFSSPKRINTLQNSRYIPNNTISTSVDNNPLNHPRNNLKHYGNNFVRDNHTTKNYLDNTKFSNKTTENFLNNTNTNSFDNGVTPNLILDNTNSSRENDSTNEDTFRFAVDNLTIVQNLDGVDNEFKELRWCNATTTNLTQANNQNLATSRNLNFGNVAASQLGVRAQAQSAVTSPGYFSDVEPPSPDDVLIRDDLDIHHSGVSSSSISPREEDSRAFEISESVDSSDELNDENLACENSKQPQNLRCIVNPNYPGFQHLAHTLIDGYSEENLNSTVVVDNNANNNNLEEELLIDKFDSINRLDSIENIQKVFHDKTVLDIKPIELGDSPSSAAQELVESTTSVEQDLVSSSISVSQNTLLESAISLEQDLTTDNNLTESTTSVDQEIKLDCDVVESTKTLEIDIDISNKNTEPKNNKPNCESELNKLENVVISENRKTNTNNYETEKSYVEINNKVLDSVVGDFSKEVTDELDRVGLSAEQFENQLKELELVADKLKKISDPSPSILKQYFEPNFNKPFEKNIQEGKETELKKDAEIQLKKDTVFENKELHSANNNLIKISSRTSLDFAQDLIEITFKNQKLTKNNNEINNFDRNNPEFSKEAEIVKTKEPIRPSTLNLPVGQIKRPSGGNILFLDDESAEDLKAEQLIMCAKLIDISRTPTFENTNLSSENSSRVLDLRGYDANMKRIKMQQNTALCSQSSDLSITTKMVDAALSNAKENIPKVNSFIKDTKNPEKNDKNDKKREWVRYDEMKRIRDAEKAKSGKEEKFDEKGLKFNKEDLTKNLKEKDRDTTTGSLSKKAKFSNYIRRRIDYGQQLGSLITFPKKDNVPRRENSAKNRDPMNRRSVPMVKPKASRSETLGGFDVYNIETAMPKIDLEAIESHLRAAREEERRRRTDREEIRRRLAMGSEDDYYTDRPGRKPSLQSRLQSGMNLQICFMNETVSDTDSPTSDSESPITNPKQPKYNQNANTNCKNLTNIMNNKSNERERPLAQRPATLPLQSQQTAVVPNSTATSDADFFTKQARLQTEARMALAQAKEMARMQMEIEKQRQKKSPITEMVRNSLEKVGIPFPEEKRRLSRQILTEMNVAQLQVIVNDLHTQIETLNENLVKFLMDRDDLHMEQDSMLVDIEDLTRYLSAKEQVLKDHSSPLIPTPQNNNLPPPSPAPPSPLQSALNNTVRPHLHRIASLVKK